MQRLLTAAGMWSLVPYQPLDARQGASKGSSDEEIRRASDEWFEALRQTDLAAIDRLEADDFLTIQEAPTGVAVIEKRTQLASLKKGAGAGVKLRRDLSNVRIRRYGDTAILTAVAVFQQDDAAATPAGTKAVVTEVWVTQNNRWRIAHFATHPVRNQVRR